MRSRSTRSPSATVLFGLGSPVRAGSAVFEAAPGTTAHVRPLRHATWLFWEDHGFQELFVHPSVLLLVDAKTGKVMRKSQLGWFPLINGRRPAFLASSAAYHDPHYWVASVHLPAVRAGASARAAAPPPVAIKPGELSHDCLVMIGDRHEPILTGSFAPMLQWSRNVGVKSYPDQATNVASLRSTIARARADECDDVFLFIAGHGTRRRDGTTQRRTRCIPAARPKSTSGPAWPWNRARGRGRCKTTCSLRTTSRG